MTDAPAASPGLVARDHVRVVLTGVEVDVKCGLHPWERHPERPNRLRIDVEMFAPWPVPGAGYVDYDRVRDFILGWRDRPHVDLLETLLGQLSDFVLEDPTVESCRVKIVKPDIFAETREAGVELFRTRERT